MSAFFRFPRIPHLVGLGTGFTRDDKVLSGSEADALLAREVVIEEKLDGANLGLSVGPDGGLRLQNRGQYLVPPYSGQFDKANAWLGLHRDQLAAKLGHGEILFGEWCAARHSLTYDQLPDWFLVFDVYDKREARFWSTPRRNALAARLGLAVVPLIGVGRSNLTELKQMVIGEPSRVRTGPMEGVVIRNETRDWLEARAKLVRPDFTQAIGEHWRRRRIEWNRLKGAVPGSQ
ncbi:RNA ligase family protein [Magnetospirillum sp. 15-1]|uniref:RNA ligase family protein n=1 Tax=Magnetospirillum sp. 15-1 TaxID=1979370 RepID=UPI000BBC216F|nr:RNA ligase family protein [Magnetospirillum sp. 15-1]